MKKILPLVLGMMLLCGSTYATNNKNNAPNQSCLNSIGDRKSIKPEQLPSAARHFVMNNWNNVTVNTAIMETEGYKIEYTVTLADGTTIEFNRDGGWKEIEATQEIPESAIPAAIRTYVLKMYKGQKVVKLERDKKGYEVELSNDKELKFDLEGNLK